MALRALTQGFRPALIAGAILLAACGQVLGIEDAHVDPTFVANGEAHGTPPSCNAYCDAMATSCDAQHSQYADRFQCLAVCNQLPAGSLEDRAGNTVSCRQDRARAASTASEDARATLCREAGPSGGGGCGTSCEAYCTLMMAVCAPGNSAASYPDLDTCLADCTTLPEIPYAYGDPIFGGNTVQCRTFYAGFAAQGESEDCERARGLTVCVEPGADAASSE